MGVGSSDVELGTEDTAEAISGLVSAGKLELAGVEGATKIPSDVSVVDEREDTGAAGA